MFVCERRRGERRREEKRRERKEKEKKKKRKGNRNKKLVFPLEALYVSQRITCSTWSPLTTTTNTTTNNQVEKFPMMLGKTNGNNKNNKGLQPPHNSTCHKPPNLGNNGKLTPLFPSFLFFFLFFFSQNSHAAHNCMGFPYKLKMYGNYIENVCIGFAGLFAKVIVVLCQFLGVVVAIPLLFILVLDYYDKKFKTKKKIQKNSHFNYTFYSISPLPPNISLPHNLKIIIKNERISRLRTPIFRGSPQQKSCFEGSICTRFKRSLHFFPRTNGFPKPFEHFLNFFFSFFFKRGVGGPIETG